MFLVLCIDDTPEPNGVPKLIIEENTVYTVIGETTVTEEGKPVEVYILMETGPTIYWHKDRFMKITPGVIQLSSQKYEIHAN